ncbi:ISAs1 family transposase [Rheinheimera riviphila]|uniref:ISAs1 family transposase n=1 Tax=Rheinheimera riviphila TaxID=1834037 RepID=A0A437QC06_9GAMM|nr:ISAs1 family transposase [Rheinheimera riviphila]RVU31975.1 ISAs1 family transposase [Rheinheimera riviphila]
MQTDSFTLHFSALKDQRQSAKVHYPLFDIIFLTLCAVMTGAEGWEDIEDFGVHRLDWLQKRGFFKHGIPVHDTIARVISQLEPALLQQCFIDWMCDVSSRTEGELVAIDGKTLRGSWQPGNRSSAIHMVSAFACSSSLVLGQVKTEEKSNEIRAIPELLRLLEIKGCLISIDAMGCQKQIAQQIIEQKGDYLLAVKGNQGRLHSALDKSFQAYESIERQDTEQQKSRLEGRSYQVLSAVVLPEDIREQWPMLKTIAVASSYRMTKDQYPSYERRYFISSAELDVDQFANACRSHWLIENQLHWVLDVSMNEDNCQIYRANAPANLASIRHIGLNMLRQDKSRKLSVPRKKRALMMDPGYLDAVLEAGIGVFKK